MAQWGMERPRMAQRWVEQLAQRLAQWRLGQLVAELVTD
jgi:hypothetical protein